MKIVHQLIIILIFATFSSGCSDKNSAASTVSDVGESIQTPDTQTYDTITDPTSSGFEHQSSDPAQITKVSWKGINYGQSFFDLYVTVNGEDYYVGIFFGENLSMSKNTDAPENILTYFYGAWTGAGSFFYIMKKSDVELAVMYHDYPYKSDPFESEDYDEILVIPIVEGSKIQIEDPVIIRESYYMTGTNPIVYDGLVLGGTAKIPWHKQHDWLPDCYDVETEITGEMGYRLFENGQYLDTAAVPYNGFLDENPNIQYNGEIFQGLAINNIYYPIRFGDKTSLDTSAQVYQDYIADILAENGLEGESVHISEIIKTDIEGDGTEDVLIIASNANFETKIKGQYSIVVLRRMLDDHIESIYLVKDIRTNLPADLSGRIIYEYKLCEIVDLNYDGVCEFLIKGEYFEGYCYQVYEFADNEFRVVLSNGRKN